MQLGDDGPATALRPPGIREGRRRWQRSNRHQAQGEALAAPPSAQTQARILAEALPHMQRYDRQTVVVKYGGHAMGDPALAAAFAQDIVLLKQAGVNPIVVHGGGPQIAGMLKRLQLKSEFVHGLRVTDKPTVEVVEMVLAGLINKDIVTAINRQGGKAVGISGKDANLMIARKITEMPDPRIEPDAGGRHRLRRRSRRGQPAHRRGDLGSDLIPVIAPVAISREGETLNINADTFASALAARMKAKRLLLLTDVAGVLDKDGKLIAAAHDRGGAQADPRRHHHRRHDPQDRGLHRGGGGRRRGGGHHRRARAALRAAGALHRARRRHAGRPQGEEGHEAAAIGDALAREGR